MQELSGWTAIDTLYELKGFQIAALFSGPLFTGLVTALFGFGIVMTLYRSSENRRFRAVIVYILGAFVIMWLIQPVTVKVKLPAGYAYDGTLEDLVESARTGQQAHATIEGVPRIMALGHYAVDAVTRFMTLSVNRAFAKQPFEHDRAALLLRRARIEDVYLREYYQKFVIYCYLPVLAARDKRRESPPHPYYDPFETTVWPEYSRFSLPGEDLPDLSDYLGSVLPIVDSQMLDILNPLGIAGISFASRPDVPCTEAVSMLNRSLDEHVWDDGAVELHTAVSAALQAKEARPKIDVSMGSLHPETLKIIRRYVVFNETVGLMSTNEIKMLMEALPDYEMFDRKTQSSSNGEGTWGQIRSTISWTVKLFQSVDQWIDKHGEGPALYYRVTSYGPYVYGLTSMIILSVFPIAGFIALLPGHWTSLFTWMKFLLWVKLWILFWAILSKFNEWRWSLDGIGSGYENGIGDQTYIFPAIAAMYLLTPGLSYIAIQLLSAAAKGVSGVAGGSGMAPGGGGGGGANSAGMAADGAQAAGKAAVEAAAAA